MSVSVASFVGSRGSCQAVTIVVFAEIRGLAGAFAREHELAVTAVATTRRAPAR
jgi:hypothetical protein